MRTRPSSAKWATYFFWVFFIAVVQILACKKTDTVEPSSPPVSVADSTFVITMIKKIDINDFDISYKIKPPAGENYLDAKLHWSTNEKFDDGDSFLISNDVVRLKIEKHSLKRLKQAQQYFTRLSVSYKGKKFYSRPEEFATPRLSLTLPAGVSRNLYTTIKSNFAVSAPTTDTGTRLFIGEIPCEIVITTGETTAFIPPMSLETKKYAVRFERNGISVQAADSIEILPGKWFELTPPEFPGYFERGVGYYSSCFSDEKGYIVPGRTEPVDHTNPGFGKPGYILEFDGASNQWTKIIPTNIMYFDNPNCHYANNSIYLISGATTNFYGADYEKVKKMLRFDLSSSTWKTMDSLPYPSMFNQVSFEFNKEFYIGLGADENYGDNRCCAIPSKKFWKYNPYSNAWTQIADFPGGRDYFMNNTTGFSVGNKAYIFYGNGQQVPTFNQELWEYNPDINTWRQLSLPEVGGPPLGDKYSIITHNNKAYFITAQIDERTIESSYKIQTACLEFDPQTGNFKKFAEGKYMDLMKLVFKSGNRFVFQSDAIGYLDMIPNRTHELILE